MSEDWLSASICFFIAALIFAAGAVYVIPLVAVLFWPTLLFALGCALTGIVCILARPR